MPGRAHGKNKPLILHVFDGFRVGGTELRTCRILNALQGDFRHIVVSCNGNFSARSLVDPRVDVSFVFPEFLGGNRLQQLWAIASYIKKQAPDFLVAYEWGAIDWVMANTLWRNCPTVMTVEGFEEAELWAQKKTRWLLRRLLYPRCDRVVTCSKLLYDLALSSWKVTVPGRVIHIPNGINCLSFQPSAETRANGPKNEIFLGTVGSLIPLKNHERLLIAFSRLARAIPCRLIIVGDGPEREPLMRRCVELDIVKKVRFTGRLRSPAEQLRNMDIFCLSSDTEQMPMVILEAMATGLPIVSTNVGDIRDMVAPENRRYIVHGDDIQGFTNAMRELAGSAEKRKVTGRANLEKARREYDEEIMFSRYRALYLEIAGKHCLAKRGQRRRGAVSI